MNDINQWAVSGKLGRDPEYRETRTGKGFCSGSIACSNSYKDRDGQWQTGTNWFDFVIWGGGAKIFAEAYKKGDTVSFAGEASVSTWEKDGQKRSKVQLTVHQFPPPPKRQQGGFDAPQGFDAAMSETPTDDIPF